MTPVTAPLRRNGPIAALQVTLRRLDAFREARALATAEGEATLDAAERARSSPVVYALDGSAATGAAGPDPERLFLEQTLLRAALAVAIERAGGQFEYTEADFLAVMKRCGPHGLEGIVDPSGPGGPVIRLRVAPRTKPAANRRA